MLKSLTVTNFALIEHAFVEFDHGLNILTGETGAGKSILIDALGILLGNRASSDLIRSHCDYLQVEAVFDITREKQTQKVVEEQNIVMEDDGILIVSRRITRNGKNSVVVNGCQIPLNSLRQIGRTLIDMQGQHEYQELLRSDYYLLLLDNWTPEGKILAGQYRQLYCEWSDLRDELASVETSSRELAQRFDVLTWQTNEIAAAKLQKNEEEDLENEIKRLANAEKILNALNNGYNLLNQGGKGMAGIIPAMSEVKRELEFAARYDSQTEKQVALLTDILYQLKDASLELREQVEAVEFNPDRLAVLQERLDLIHRLKRKYGASVDSILAYYNEAMEECSQLSNMDERVTDLTRKLAAKTDALNEIVNRLSETRQSAAREISQQISVHLADLGMTKAKVKFELAFSSQFTPIGRDEVTVWFSANEGEESKPLQRIASGGELSRIALAIKTVAAYRDDITTMVFDEVDAGIGGRTAQMVGEKIAFLAGNRQILCITHLPAVACMADAHIYIEKRTGDGRTSTVIKKLDEPERLLELTRMIAGTNTTQLAIENAAQMIEQAYQKKEKWKNKAQS
ncbi:dna recombination/repair protein recn [Lucifera butyrica]|uniref:DNA repair protein RecN n=1 Tax=Lucifera butyrica TaxID=1351585 RepID=A0A498RAK4_9FIRM|nr:DNA repair protein RecN [Lucifera butyrica]VBB08000.1 dna recombination/repair protein recn [Lucifera butyrica]